MPAKNIRTIYHLQQALRAHALFKRDKDYVVTREGEIVIVDQFTGRLLKGRRYNEGLHQAIEAKEGVNVQEESMTLATISFQNYFRLYDKLSGMTGTDKTEAGKFKALINEVKTLHKKGQPVLIGTVSIENNERLSQLLTEAKVPHQ